MRIGIMAAGAVGGYFGARLAAAGHDVTFIARGAQRDAMRSKGLTLHSTFGDLHLPHPTVTDDPATVGAVDIVLFAVKLWDTEHAAALIKPMVGAGTRVITLQNGVDSVERMAPILGADTVVGGSAYIGSVIAAPGVISHTSPFAAVHCGRADGAADPQLTAFAEAGRAAGFEVVLADDITRGRWEKFIFLSALAGATAGTRQPVGAVMADDDMRRLFRRLMEEAFAVGRASGVRLGDDYLDGRMRFAAETVDPGMKASMAHDLERGNRLELDWLTGRVVALGREHGVAVPASETVYALLKPYRMGAP